MLKTDPSEEVRTHLRELESEIGLAREYVLRCRAEGEEPAARLHVAWIDLLLEEWSRCRVAGSSKSGARRRDGVEN